MELKRLSGKRDLARRVAAQAAKALDQQVQEQKVLLASAVARQELGKSVRLGPAAICGSLSVLHVHLHDLNETNPVPASSRFCPGCCCAPCAWSVVFIKCMSSHPWHPREREPLCRLLGRNNSPWAFFSLPRLLRYGIDGSRSHG